MNFLNPLFLFAIESRRMIKARWTKMRWNQDDFQKIKSTNILLLKSLRVDSQPKDQHNPREKFKLMTFEIQTENCLFLKAKLVIFFPKSISIQSSAVHPAFLSLSCHPICSSYAVCWRFSRHILFFPVQVPNSSQVFYKP